MPGMNALLKGRRNSNSIKTKMKRIWYTDKIIAVLAACILACAALFLGGCGDDDEEKDPSVTFTAGSVPVDASGIVSDAGDGGGPAIMIVKDGLDTDASEDNISEEESADESPDDVSDDNAGSDDEETGEDETDKEDDTASDRNAVPGSVEQVSLSSSWKYSDFSKINSGCAVLYRAAGNRKGVVIGVNAGHGTKGGQSVKTFCHPDQSPKVTGGSTAQGSITAAAVSGGMSFNDGASEASVTLKTATLLKDRLLAEGYDVMMLRDGSDVQLDNIARTVIANNTCACLISIHWDGDGLGYDKGCFYISTPDGLKGMEPVASHWQQHEALGQALIAGLQEKGCKIYQNGKMAIDLTQTSYSTIPSVDVELGNQSSAHDDASLSVLADGLAGGVKKMF